MAKRRRKSRSSGRKFHVRRSRKGGRRRRVANPFGGRLSVRGATGYIMPAATGAVGAMLMDVGLSYADRWLPDFLKAGWGRVGAQALIALGLGYLGSRVNFIGRKNAALFASGALTVVAYNALRPVIAGAIGDRVPGLGGLADLRDFNAYMNPAAMLTGGAPVSDNGMGAYMPNGVLATRALGAYMGAGIGGRRFANQGF